MLKDEIAQIKKLFEAKVPMFGICLGHQLLSNAAGYETYKLKFGQHGANHPVQNLHSKSIEITAQNHNYNVPESIAEVCEITHRNLFDGTIRVFAIKIIQFFRSNTTQKQALVQMRVNIFLKNFLKFCEI